MSIVDESTLSHVYPVSVTWLTFKV